MNDHALVRPAVEPAIVLSVRNATKDFGGPLVLKGVSFDVMAGTIVGLLGQNGSGKSTLIKIISGFHEPNPGSSVSLNGEPLKYGEPLHFRPISFVHQNLGLFDDATVLENLMVNRWADGGGHINWRAMRALAQQLMHEFSLDYDLSDKVHSLSQGDKAVLAIARAVGELQHVDRGLLVLDEPTPYLARSEVARLFRAMRSAAARGIGILFVSHRLEEVRGVTDRVVVLRDGVLVGDSATADVDDDELVELIIGRRISEFYPEMPAPSSEAVLRIQGVAKKDSPPFDLDVRRSEIVGLTGLLGSGFEDIPYLLAGAVEGTGTILLGDRQVDLAGLNPSAAIDLGMALVPADRTRLGVAAGMSVGENISLPWLSRLAGRFRIDRKAERAEIESLMDRFDVLPRNPQALIGSLSGGNQQKAVLARWIAGGPRVLLMHEPTQGVDIGARQHIFASIRDAVADGMSVIYASLEYEDLAHMCDRVLVFRERRVVAEIRGSELTAEHLADISLRSVAV